MSTLSLLEQQLLAVDAYSKGDFLGLAEAAGLEPSSDLRFNDWTNFSFANEVLKGCDFTGASLQGARFFGATIQDARFDQAVLGVIGAAEALPRADLTSAADWVEHCRCWAKHDHLSLDLHLEDGEIFQDAPFAPLLVALPYGSGGHPNLRLAVAENPISAQDMELYRLRNSGRSLGLESADDVLLTWAETSQYLGWLLKETGRHYRAVTEAEWEFALSFGGLEQPRHLRHEWLANEWHERADSPRNVLLPPPKDPATTRVRRAFGALGPLTRTFGYTDGDDRATFRVSRELEEHRS